MRIPVMLQAILVFGTALQPGNAGTPKKPITEYHQGPWEKEIGYSQAVRVGNHVYISGTTGDPAADLETQLKQAYEGIRKTLAHYKADFSNIVVERIYTTDLDQLIKLQPVRKQLYGERMPAATWVEVKRLYLAGQKLEIEVELEL